MCVAGTRITQEGVDSMETKNQDRISELVEKQKDTYTSMADEIWDMRNLVFRNMNLRGYNRNTLRLADFQSGLTLPREDSVYCRVGKRESRSSHFLVSLTLFPVFSRKQTVRSVVRFAGKTDGHGCGPPSSRTASVAAVDATKVLYGRKRPEGYDPLLWLSGGGECGRKGISGAGDGYFNDCDIAITWHPSTTNKTMGDDKFLANFQCVLYLPWNLLPCGGSAGALDVLRWMQWRSWTLA